jgi:signal transduction histidine kinase
MKTNFLSSVSHELRSPLVAMEKSINLILNKNTGPINESQEQFLSIADRNIKRLGRLINDLLDLTKLEAGKLDLKPQPSSIERIINESVEGLNTWAQTKSINIEHKIQDGLPLVNVDADRLIQVLINLIGNAIKFTPNNGNITVEAVLNKDKEELEVSVKDTGIGIDKENLAKVFDKFYQVGERSPADITGTGIGLAISREIVELHGGKIWVESEKGFGAKFIFTLPAKSA